MGQPLKLVLLVCVAVVIVLLEPVVLALTEICRIERLRSDTCINETKCPPWKNEEMVITHCRYTVKEGYSYKCYERHSGTRLEFVTPELQCEAGYIASPEVDEDNSDIIVVYKKPCPQDSYQPEPSGCYDACRLKHNRLDLLKSIKSFKIYSTGNSVHPAQVFCNFEDGYYSTDGTDFFYYNNRFVSLYKNFCIHVNESNPCTDGQFPLHNKTCVSPCRQGYERVVHDDFLCKRSNGSDVSHNEKNDEGRITTGKNIENGMTKRKNDIVTQATDDNEPTLKGKPKSSTIPWEAIIIGVTAAAAVFLAVLGLVTYIIKRKWNGYRRANSSDPPSTVSTDGISGQQFKKPIDDVLCQSMVDSIATQMKSVGALLQNGNLLGTVYRVGKDCVATAWHVIEPVIGPHQPGQNIDSKLRGVFLNFNEKLLDMPTRIYKVDKIVWKHVQLDVVFLRISNPDKNLPRPVMLWKGPMSGLELTSVSFVGYGYPDHPNKKHLDPKCNLVSANTERIKSAHAWYLQEEENLKAIFWQNDKETEAVALGYQGFDKKEMFLFDSNLEEGSSGSPAFTNNEMSIMVVGMLTHGYPKCYHELKKLSIQVQFPVEYRFETGVRMEYIYNYMEPKIRDEFFL